MLFESLFCLSEVPRMIGAPAEITVWLYAHVAPIPYPYTRQDADLWIAHGSMANGAVTKVIELQGVFVGSVAITPQAGWKSHAAEIGYWLAEPFWGQGIATEAVRQMVEYVFYYFDIVRIYAEVFEINKSSMRVLEKNGFYLEGVRRKAVLKNAKLMDDYIWVKIRPW